MTQKTDTLSAEEPVANAAFPELGNGVDVGALRDIDVLGDVRLEVTVELGRIAMKVRDLLALQEGAVVDLNRTAGAAVDVVVNGTLVARGDVVVVDDELGVRITEVVERR
ncbi:MAG: flagellar motor switch protein FliN [Actinomycetes bacterium]